MNKEITENVAYEKGYDQGFANAQNKWIQIKDEAPEENRILIYFFDGLTMPFWIGFYFGRDEDYPSEDNHIFGSPAGFLTGDVTHWMYVNAPKQYDWVMDNNEELAKSLKDSIQKARLEFDEQSKTNKE